MKKNDNKIEPYIKVASHGTLSDKNTFHALSGVIRAAVLAIPLTITQGAVGLTKAIGDPLVRIMAGSNLVHHRIGDAKNGVHWGRSAIYMAILGLSATYSADQFQGALEEYAGKVGKGNVIKTVQMKVDKYRNGKRISLERIAALKDQIKRALSEERGGVSGSGGMGESAMYWALQTILESGRGFPARWGSWDDSEREDYIVTQLNDQNPDKEGYNKKVAKSLVRQLKNHPDIASFVVSVGGTGLREHLLQKVQVVFGQLDAYANQVQEIINKADPNDENSVDSAIEESEVLLDKLKYQYNQMNKGVEGTVSEANKMIKTMGGDAGRALAEAGVSANPNPSDLHITPAQMKFEDLPDLDTTTKSTPFWQNAQKLRAIGGIGYWFLLIQGILEIIGLMLAAAKARKEEVIAARPLTNRGIFYLPDARGTAILLAGEGNDEEEDGFLMCENTRDYWHFVGSYMAELHTKVNGHAEDMDNKSAARVVAGLPMYYDYGKVTLPLSQLFGQERNAYSEMIRTMIAAIPQEEVIMDEDNEL